MADVDPIREATVPAPVTRSAGIGRATQNVLVRFAVGTFNRVRNAFSDLLRHSAETVFERLEQGGIDLIGPLLDRAIDSPDIPPDVKRVVRRIRSGEHQAGIFAVIAVLASVAAILLPPLLAGLSEKLRNTSMGVFRPGVIGAADAIHAERQSPQYRSLVQAHLESQGLSEETIAMLKDTMRVRPGIAECLTLWLRDEMSESDLIDRFHKLGVNPADFDDYKALAQSIPGPGDLVRFALREAWTDSVAARYGYDADYVAEFGEWMEKLGYSADWARKYWRSHWLVPSVGQAFEMLQRGVIGDAELDDLLKVQDIPSGWRDNLKKIAYTPLGRIDTRWAYEEGLINEDRVLEAFKSQGYNEPDAVLMTRITVSRAVSEVKGLTRSAVEKAYRKRRVSRGVAIEMLGDIGIHATIAGFYLDQVDQDRADELLDRRVDAVEKLFINGQIDENTTYDRLGSLGLGADEIAADIEVWNVVRSSQVKRPSRASLDKFFRQGVVDLEGYRRRMGVLSYPSADIDLYLSSLTLERAEAAGEQERKSRDEQERIRKSRLKSDYQIDKAVLDTDIAELQTAIADAQVAMVAAQSERDERLRHALSTGQIAALRREYQPLLRAVDAAIAEARLSIAALQSRIGERKKEVAEIRRSLAVGWDIAAQESLRTERLTLDTQIASLGTRIAGRGTTIAELQEQIPSMATADERERARGRLLVLKREIAEFQEAQAEMRERQEEIDEALRKEFSAIERDALASDVADIQVRIAGLGAQADVLREAIRESQSERSVLEAELDEQIAALPGKAEQIAIRSDYDGQIDELETRIAEFRANIAALRLAKSSLAVGFREAGG